jgi:hypothetical protein
VNVTVLIVVGDVAGSFISTVTVARPTSLKVVGTRTVLPLTVRST